MFTLLADTWHGPGPWILVLPLFWFGVIALAFFFFARRGGCGPRGRWAGAGGRSVLDERFARGEISADEYRERRSVLDEGARR
jgi:putative membrane protein